MVSDSHTSTRLSVNSGGVHTGITHSRPINPAEFCFAASGHVTGLISPYTGSQQKMRHQDIRKFLSSGPPTGGVRDEQFQDGRTKKPCVTEPEY